MHRHPKQASCGPHLYPRQMIEILLHMSPLLFDFKKDVQNIWEHKLCHCQMWGSCRFSLNPPLTMKQWNPIFSERSSRILAGPFMVKRFGWKKHIAGWSSIHGHGDVPSGYLTQPWEMAHRNRWFTELKDGDFPWRTVRHNQIPSGKPTKSYWTWQFIVDLPINGMVIPHSFLYVYQRVLPMVFTQKRVDESGWPAKYLAKYHCFCLIWNMFSMAMTQEPIYWRYLPYIRPM